jgi:uncharacterized protein YfiM (DUF2279 family)
MKTLLQKVTKETKWNMTKETNGNSVLRYLGLLLLIGSACGIQAATVTGLVYTAQSQPMSRTQIEFLSQSAPFAGTNVITSATIVRTTTGTNGAFSTTLVEGSYVVRVGISARDTFYITVPVGSGTYDWRTLVNSGTPVSMTQWTLPAAKGDLLTHNGTNQVVVPIGTHNYVVTADTNSAAGWAWAAAPGATGGEANTASNLGTGEGVYASKSSVDLQFKSLVGGSNVVLSSTATEVTINSAAGGVTAAITNGLATTNWVGDNYQPLDSDLTALAGVGTALTNGLATTGYVTGQGYVTSALTNGLTTLEKLTNYVASAGGAQGLSTNWVNGTAVVGVNFTNTASIVFAAPGGSNVTAALNATGTPDGTKFLRDDYTWQVTGASSGAQLNGTNTWTGTNTFNGKTFLDGGAWYNTPSFPEGLTTADAITGTDFKMGGVTATSYLTTTNLLKGLSNASINTNLAAGSVTVSNVTASLPAVFDAAKNLTNSPIWFQGTNANLTALAAVGTALTNGVPLLAGINTFTGASNIFNNPVYFGAGVVINGSGDNTFNRIVSTNVNVDAITASRAIVTDAAKNLTNSATTAAEIGYVSGVTSAIQTQLDNRQATNANLTSWAAVAPGANVGTFLATPSSANLRGALTDETGTGIAFFVGGDAGASTATTASANDNDTSIATTAYVQTELGAYNSDTVTFTGKTLDAAGTGNVLKQTRYITLQRPDYGDGAGAIPQTNSYTASGLMHYTLSGNAETNANWIVYEFPCPADLDTGVALTATFSFLSGGTDTDDYVFHVTYGQVAAGTAYPTGTGIASLPITMTVNTATEANGDIQTSAATTLTGWAAALTPGAPMAVRVARLQNTQDDGARDVSLVIAYGSTQ